jgi:glycosyltransferase involved in cell wall biosynthesis
MNVLYLTNNAGRASTTVPTRGWFENLVPKGLRPVLASPILGELSEWCREREIPSYQVELPFPDKLRPWRFGKSIWKLRQIVKRHKIELIHCNEQDVYPVGQYLARLSKLPVVVSVHFTMRRDYCTWAFGGKKVPQRIIFTSNGNLNACQCGVEGVIPEERWRLLYNGVDLNRYRPDDRVRREFRQAKLSEEDIAIGVACAIRPRKQLEHLFEAALRINEERLKVVIAGAPVAGDEVYARDLLESAKRRLGNRLVLLGHVNDLLGFYNGLDVFVNTSQEEACSLSVIECLASGCPILGYASKSVDDQILPEGGEIVPQDNVDDLTAALTRWISNRGELSSRRASARERAEKMFDIRKRSLQLWDEYRDVLANWDRKSVKAAPL